MSVDLSLMLSGKGSQLNADDLDDTGKVIKITRAEKTGGEQPLALHFERDDGKPFLPCLTMRRVLAHIWGTEGEKFAGRLLHVYRDPNVIYGGKKVGGVRIKGASHIDRPVTYMATVRRGKKEAVTIQPIKEGPDNSQPKSVSGPSPREMIEAVRQTTTVEDLKKLTSEDEFKKRREWLKANRPTASEQIERAVSEALARFEAMDEEMPV